MTRVTYTFVRPERPCDHRLAAWFLPLTPWPKPERPCFASAKRVALCRKKREHACSICAINDVQSIVLVLIVHNCLNSIDALQHTCTHTLTCTDSLYLLTHSHIYSRSHELDMYITRHMDRLKRHFRLSIASTNEQTLFAAVRCR